MHSAAKRPDLGRLGTVVFHHESEEPVVVSEQIKNDWPDFGVGYLDDIALVSVWSFHVALYALQNPTPENVERALTLIAQSGDCEDWLDDATLEVMPVAAPDGWDRG